MTYLVINKARAPLLSFLQMDKVEEGEGVIANTVVLLKNNYPAFR